jgi:hypothetical protein
VYVTYVNSKRSTVPKHLTTIRISMSSFSASDGFHHQDYVAMSMDIHRCRYTLRCIGFNSFTNCKVLVVTECPFLLHRVRIFGCA